MAYSVYVGRNGVGKVRKFPCLSLKFQKIDLVACWSLIAFLSIDGPLRRLRGAGKFSTLGDTQQRRDDQEKQYWKT